ncbi:MAG: RDD family protein [Solirubrobacterales bacterium]
MPDSPEPSRPPYAGIVTRGLAFALDLAIVLGIVTAFGLVFVVVQAFTGAKPSVSSLEVVLVALGYGLSLTVYLTIFWSLAGQTPGMRTVKIELTTLSGQRLRPRRCLLRVAGLVLAAFPLFAGYLLILATDRRQGLQDLMSNSVVRYSQADSQPLSFAAVRERRR